MYSINSVIRHEGYPGEYGHSLHDIALVKVERPITFSDKVKPIALEIEVVGNENATVAGWGLTCNGTTNHLRYIEEYSTITDEKCKEFWNHPYKDVLCAIGDVGTGTCDGGDTGSALVVKGKQVGISSFIVNGCGVGFPAGFTRISDYIEWVEHKLHLFKM